MKSKYRKRISSSRRSSRRSSSKKIFKGGNWCKSFTKLFTRKEDQKEDKKKMTKKEALRRCTATATHLTDTEKKVMQNNGINITEKLKEIKNKDFLDNYSQ